MQELIAKMVGKKVDIFCGGVANLRGKVVKVDGGVLHLVAEDDQMFYVAVEKIVIVNEIRANDQRVGFISGHQK
ncbi:MAG: MM0924 family protein [Pyrinomonadaceae bacterium]